MSPLDPDLAGSLSKMMRADLDVWTSFWFWILVGSTIAVVVGIICEAPEVWQALGSGNKTVARIRKFWYIRVRKSDLNGWERLYPELAFTNDRPRKWIVRAEFVGWTLVALGVAGEGVAEYFVNDAETNVRAFDETVLIETQYSADSAAAAASVANTFADRAVTSSSSALALANGARQEADSVHQELGKAASQLTQLEAEAQKTEADLINLALCNAPRVLPVWAIGHTKTSVDQLKAFAGREVVIEFIPYDPEARRAASSIAVALDRAGWKIVKVSTVDGIADGVEIQAYFKRASKQDAPQEDLREWQIHVRSSEAVDALIDFLHSYNWQAESKLASPEANDIPPYGLKVRVGMYPAVTYVAPPGEKDLAAAIAQFNDETEKTKKKIEDEIRKRDEETLKRLPPQQAAELKARNEEWNKEERLRMERYGNPCHSLTPLSPTLR